MKKIIFLLIVTCLSLSGFSQTSLVKLWESDSLFKIPESVCFDAANKVLYVANIDGDAWTADGKGSIGKLSTDGKIIAAEWVKGVQAPKGMGLVKNKLYVADLTELVVIDVKKGEIIKKIPLPGAVGLNDVCADDKGVIYVTDMRGKKLYRVVNDVPELMVSGLQNPNGVLKTKDALWVLDANAVNRVNADNTLTKTAEGLQGGPDGIEQTGENSFIVTCWGGVIYQVNTSTNEKTILLDGRPQKMNTADLGINHKEKIIYVPTFGQNTVVAFKWQ